MRGEQETVGAHDTPPTTPPLTAAERISIWKLGGLPWHVLAGRVWREIYKGILLTHAAALAFYFLIALFPLVLFLLSILGFFTGSVDDLRALLLANLARVAPASAYTLVQTTVDEITQNAGGGKLSRGLLIALWLSSSGMVAISEALNAMYGVHESRPWWKVRLAAAGLTITLAVLISAALLLIIYGGEVGEQAAGYFDQGQTFAILWTVAQVPVVLVFVLFAFALIYYFSPNLFDQKWYWITPGSVAGVALWVFVSLMFRIYLRHFNSYSITYGSLGAVIILMLWFYLTGVAILLGGKINAEIEGAAAAVGVPGAKHHGEKTASPH